MGSYKIRIFKIMHNHNHKMSKNNLLLLADVLHGAAVSCSNMDCEARRVLSCLVLLRLPLPPALLGALLRGRECLGLVGGRLVQRHHDGLADTLAQLVRLPGSLTWDSSRC